MLKIGQKAPSFSLPATTGKQVTLADFAGRKLVLYFYPKDDTPGCTIEACDFRDNLARLGKSGAVVVGVSGDSLTSHDKFRAKYKLPFELLFDEASKVATLYGAYGDKLMYGRKIKGTIRSTFLINEQGKIAEVWSPVKVSGHVDEVLAALAASKAALSAAVAAAAPANAAPKASKLVLPKQVAARQPLAAKLASSPKPVIKASAKPVAKVAPKRLAAKKVAKR